MENLIMFSFLDSLALQRELSEPASLVTARHKCIHEDEPSSVCRTEQLRRIATRSNVREISLLTLSLFDMDFFLLSFQCIYDNISPWIQALMFLSNTPERFSTV